MRKILALVKKESLQIVRDPSSVLIAFVLPLILLFIFGYGVNLDSNNVKIGLVVEDDSPEVTSLVSAFVSSKFLDVRISDHRNELEELLSNDIIRGIIVIPQDYSQKVLSGKESAPLQVISDGSIPNTASFVQSYAQAVLDVWLAQAKADTADKRPLSLIENQPRFWYNAELHSRNFLIPGSIAIVMTLIGTLLSALVVAREWERGTMEAIMTTPVTIRQILIGKLVPYFLLGLCSMLICWTVAVFWYHVPFRGSFPALLLSVSVFLLAALSLGLLISTLAKDQFVASQIALLMAFMPAFMLSGFIFEISSMPGPIRTLTYIISARYLVTCLQTLFLTGTIWPLLIRSIISMAVIAIVFFSITSHKLVKRLDV